MATRAEMTGIRLKMKRNVILGRDVRVFEGVVEGALKWKKMFSYYLIQAVQGLGGGLPAGPRTEWPFVRLCPPLSHTLIRVSFSLIEKSPQWHSIRAGEWKPGYFYIFSFPLSSAGARGPANESHEQCLPPRRWLVPFLLWTEMTH